MNFVIQNTAVHYGIEYAPYVFKIAIQFLDRIVQSSTTSSQPRATTALTATSDLKNLQPLLQRRTTDTIVSIAVTDSNSIRIIKNRIDSILVSLSPFNKDILVQLFNCLTRIDALNFLSLNKTFREISAFSQGCLLLVSLSELSNPHAQKLAFADKHKLMFKIVKKITDCKNATLKEYLEAPYKNKIEVINLNHDVCNRICTSLQNIPNLTSFYFHNKSLTDGEIIFGNLPSLKTISIDNWNGLIIFNENLPIESISLSNILIYTSSCIFRFPKLKFLNLNNIKFNSSRQSAILGLDNLPNLEHLCFSGITDRGLLKSLQILQAEVESRNDATIATNPA